MQEDEERGNSHAAITRTFYGNEDDVLDQLLEIMKTDKWENLEFHYERGQFSAERTDLHTREYDGESEETGVTFALQASWFADDETEVDLMIEVTEPELDWTQPACEEICLKIMQTMAAKIPTVTDKDNGHGKH